MAETTEHPTDVRPELQLDALQREKDHAVARGDKEIAKQIDASVAGLLGKTRKGARRTDVDRGDAETSDAGE